MNAFFKCQSNYCPVIWMFHSRTLNNKINRLHERCLRIIYKDKLSNFEELLHKDKSVSTHHNNKHALAIEMYKLVYGTPPEIMHESFQTKKHYNLRYTLQFFVNPIHSVYNGTESVSYLGPKIWTQILSEIRNKKSLEGFKHIQEMETNGLPL